MTHPYCLAAIVALLAASGCGGGPDQPDQSGPDCYPATVAGAPAVCVTPSRVPCAEPVSPESTCPADAGRRYEQGAQP